MKPPILNLLFFFFALQLQAQTITGTVKDQNEQPLENTNVMAKTLGGKKGNEVCYCRIL
ncbi:carboxypeptidase regulatory-like domain-containing protein [Paenimyroides tangerinum]|uniref:Carboxypeptidase regulatory-like domain-containing protein n=1 Tax=Paenimyroides tangerinum TaxID=2488728 RepID=A0A3P3W6B6_9FLAO|nr:carboxypeptidase regulatory-like domain-containing protein [Paenimyroides tangerinum]RRJ90560.1 carboxypeptidase regulatory-like domain-containing protein [Paenimyroides tangerinum]